MSFLAGMFAGLLLVAVLLQLRRRRDAAPGSGLTDDQIRVIEERGAVEVEDPLDLDHIRDEEQRFWEESWDEPEEF